jgi:hypothetical protein
MSGIADVLNSRWVRMVVAAAIFLVLIAGAMSAVTYVFQFMREEDFKLPEIILTLVLVIAVIALLAALGGLMALLKGLGVGSGNDALGLPPGSVRAILALMLVLIFSIMSVFLYYNSVNGGGTSTGLTAQQVELLPQDRIANIDAIPGPSGGPAPSPQLYNVQMSISHESQGLAQQLITLVGTLVTAVAAFYFGSNSVASAVKARAGGRVEIDPASARAEATAAKAEADAAAAKAKQKEALAVALEAAGATVTTMVESESGEG